MGFLWIRLSDFRNLVDGRVDCDSPEVFLIGDNGQGKTNFIEAVHLLCYGSSFRSRQDGRLVRHGAGTARVEGALRVDGGAVIEVAVRIGPGKEVLVNGKPVRDRAALLDNVPCIVFCHEDFDFVCGNPERRRWFLNQTLALTHAEYLPALRRYRHILHARNLQLRDRSPEVLDEYDLQLAQVGFDLQAQRARALEQFSCVFAADFDRIARFDYPVELRYVPSWRTATDSEEARAILRSRRERDLAVGTTTCGPHRDTYAFYADSLPLEAVASTGQLRLCSLMLRAAQARYYGDRTGRLPILLLDDVILELDAGRKRAFVDNLPERDQVFYTFLRDEAYGTYRRTPSVSYHVRAGRLESCAE